MGDQLLNTVIKVGSVLYHQALHRCWYALSNVAADLPSREAWKLGSFRASVIRSELSLTDASSGCPLALLLRAGTRLTWPDALHRTDFAGIRWPLGTNGGSFQRCFRYTASVQEVGVYSVNVVVRASATGSASNAEIGSGSIKVIPNPVDAASSTVMAPRQNSTSTSGGPIVIRLQPRDRFGNPAIPAEDLDSGIDTFVAQVSYDSMAPRIDAADASHAAAQELELTAEAEMDAAPSWATSAWTPLAAGVARLAVLHVKTFPNRVIRTAVATFTVTVWVPALGNSLIQ